MNANCLNDGKGVDAMLGAIVGDIIGSRFTWRSHKSKKFEWFSDSCRVSDNTVLMLAIAAALMNCNGNFSQLGAEAAKSLREWAKAYPKAGYGNLFRNWVNSDSPKPYCSFGTGAAMRVLPCGYVAASQSEARELARAVTEITHNHPEGLKGAMAVAECVHMAWNGRTLSEIRQRVRQCYYRLNFTLDELRPIYRFTETCQETVPVALEAFFESTGYEDALRNAVSMGGDSDTIATIAGGIASAYYGGVPYDLKHRALELLDGRMLAVLSEFTEFYMQKDIFAPAGQG